MSVLELSINGHDFAARELSGKAALSRLFAFRALANAASDPPAAADLLGRPFTLRAQDGHERWLAVKGVVMSVSRSLSELGAASFELELGPAVAPLTIGQNSRVFQEMTAVDIIKKVIETAGIEAGATRWSLTGDFPERAYCVQYRESDWAFVERLLAEEGIWYFFEWSEDATTLVFSDDSTNAPELEGGVEIPFHDEGGLVSTRDSVIRVARKSVLRPELVRLRDYSFEKPRLSLDSKSGSGDLEIYDFPGRFKAPQEGDRLARVKLEALRARRTVVSGESGSTRLRPGLIFEMTEHPFSSLNGRYLLESIEYRAVAGAGVEVFWSAIPATTPFRSEVSSIVASPGGPQTGVVVGAPGEEIFPDDSGRVRVQFHWDREGAKDDKASTWMRVGQFPLGGSMILPRVGFPALVHHIEGDIDQPLVTSHLYDGASPPPYALPANKTRTAWKTATTPGGGSSNEIRFEDKAGSSEMFINASKDMSASVGDTKQAKVGVSLTRDVGGNLDESIGANLNINVKTNQNVTIGGSESLTVASTRAATIGGSEMATIGGSRSVTTTKGSSLQAKGGRSLTVGGSMTSLSALEISRSALGSMSITVGGAWITAAATGLDNATAGASAETVGGAKIAAGAAGCDTSVKGAYAETVGGAYVVSTGGNVGESATGSMVVNVGGAFMANAPTIEIEAKTEISIRCGGASLKITKSKIEVKAPTLASPGATITKKASKIKHN